jgi:hypothetical protein
MEIERMNTVDLCSMHMSDESVMCRIGSGGVVREI